MAGPAQYASGGFVTIRFTLEKSRDRVGVNGHLFALLGASLRLTIGNH